MKKWLGVLAAVLGLMGLSVAAIGFMPCDSWKLQIRKGI